MIKKSGSVRRVQKTPKGQWTITIPSDLVEFFCIDKGTELKFEAINGEYCIDSSALFIIKRVKS
ncbi:MAG: hypothetical protein LBJ20_07030 [Candidatus Methanoplasma sp.]|jgi:hypothetical protein|nr:hypothetical protein [Candidatus Methanoplasma sp.]